MDILTFIQDNMVVLIPVLWIIGNFLKKTPVIKDWTIPWILVVMGTSLAIALLGLSAQAVIQGILVAGGAVLTQNLIKQTFERNQS